MQFRHTQSVLSRIRAWRHRRRQVAALDSADADEFERAAAWFLMQGDVSQRALQRALRDNPGVACGAAATLYRQGTTSGLRHVLTRCYDEEWNTQYRPTGSQEVGAILRRLEWRGIVVCIRAVLDEASEAQDEWGCLQLLIVALSGLRTLSVFAAERRDSETLAAPTFDAAAALPLYRQALGFGPQSLRALKPTRAPRPFLNNMTHWIRMEAIQRLLRDQPSEAFPLLLAALEAEDWHVGQTAIHGLLRLNDRRALPLLESIAFTVGHPLVRHARRAIAHLAGTRAESLTLVRAAHAETEASELLRPGRANGSRSIELERATLLHVE